MRTAALLLAVLCMLPVVYAQDAVPTADDPATNARAVHLAERLRCLVCQNQSLADSHAELAVDLRRQIREQIAQGRSDEQITGYMVERYGDFVLYQPPLRATTLLLWLGPPLLLVIGFVALLRYTRARRARIAQSPLTDDERREAQRLLRQGEEGGAS